MHQLRHAPRVWVALNFLIKVVVDFSDTLRKITVLLKPLRHGDQIGMPIAQIRRDVPYAQRGRPPSAPERSARRVANRLLAIVLLFLFGRTERRAAAPLLDLHLLSKPAFLLGNMANFLSYAALFGVFFVIPFALVRVYDDSGLAAGLKLSILPVVLGLMAPVGGALSEAD